MFTATRLQIATYLLGVCPFSIAFLVFLNATISFVITDLIGLKEGVGNAVGNLGFADELVALVACPLWGLLSDKIGVRWVCFLGYSIICLALILFVQAKNVYPQLLLGRLFFSLGGAAASTMVTAVLPTMVYENLASETVQETPVPPQGIPARITREHSESITSDLTITPARFNSDTRQAWNDSVPLSENEKQFRATSKVAGFVGLLTGCGALLALLVFLRLPYWFQSGSKLSPGRAIQHSYYIVAVVALILALWCWIGLRNLEYEKNHREQSTSDPDNQMTKPSSIWKNLVIAFTAAFKSRDIALGYIGGFVARASSVAISLFIPLFINTLYRREGHCDTGMTRDGSGKSDCLRGYIVASEMTGVSQVVALLMAPVFGYVSATSPYKGLPLLFASACGIVGYPILATQMDPESTDAGKTFLVFFSVSLLGVSQIGAIVCSLGLLSNGVLTQPTDNYTNSTNSTHTHDNSTQPDESQPLLTESSNVPKDKLSLTQLKGSIAGLYSFYGGAAILILTKLGGYLFDKTSVSAPFYIMTIFNGVLFLACLALGVSKKA